MTTTEEHENRKRGPSFEVIVKWRARRLEWLDALIIKGRCAQRMKNLLRVIEGHDRFNTGIRLDLATIAQGMGCESEKTVRRAIEDCRAAGLLPKDESSKGRVNTYKIRWDVLAQMIVDHPKTTHLIAPHEAPPRQRELSFGTEEPRTLVPATPDICAGEPRTLAPQTPDTCAGNPGHLRPEPRTLAPATPDTCASGEGSDDLIHRARLKPIKETKEEAKEETKKRETVFPPELDTEEFRSLWANWTKHLQERGKEELTSAATAVLLAKLAARGPARAVAALEHSLANNWVTIHEPRSDDRLQEHRNEPGPGIKFNPTAVVESL